MANSEIISGVDSYILYSTESSYGTGGGTGTVLGGLITSASFDVDRQVMEHAGFAGTNAWDGRATAKFTPGTVAIRGTVEFKAQRFDWLQYLLLGTRTGSGTVAVPYVYPLGKATQSLTITENIDNVTTDSFRKYGGMVINSATIRASVGEPVTVSLDLLGGKIAKTTAIGTKIALLDDDLYNFSGGTIEMPDATALGNVIDSCEITINNNYELLYGFNQEAVNARAKKLNLSVRFTLKYLDDDQMDRLMGGSTAITSQTPVTLALKFTRAAAGAQYVDFVFTNVVITKITDSHTLNEFMTEDVENLASTLSVTEAQS